MHRMNDPDEGEKESRGRGIDASSHEDLVLPMLDQRCQNPAQEVIEQDAAQDVVEDI